MGRLTADDRSLIWNLRTQKGWGLMAYDKRISKQDLEASIHW